MAPNTQRRAPRGGNRPKILIAMIEAGGGHKAAAQALHAEFENAFPGRFEVVTLDIMAALGEVDFDRRHKRTWSWLLRHPGVSYRGQRLLDVAAPQRLVNAVQDAMLARFSRVAARYLHERAIDLVLAVHFMPLRAFAAAAARGEHRVPVLGVDTELLDGNALWAERRMDTLMVATETCRAELIGRGVPGERIAVTGYPLHPKYLRADRDQPTVRRRLGLDQGRMTVVHVAGGEGIGGMLEATVESVARRAPELQYVAVCGANAGLRARLGAFVERSQTASVRVEGFVDNLEELIVASDVVVGKAGPGVTSETLVLGRPIIHTSFASASEKRNVSYCEERGAGLYRSRPEAVVATLLELERDRDRLMRLRRGAEEAAPAVGTAAIVDRAAARLGVARGPSHADPSTSA